jgi:AraC family transcriptional regulator of adaptative response / DNA-3-methyladenine glycosylase II
VRHLVDFFARRAVPGVEEADDGTYRRSLALEHGDGVVEVRSDGAVVFTLDDERDRPEAERRRRDLFDLDTDTEPIAAALRDDPLIGHLVRAEPDRRVPGVVDGSELAVRAVLGQQVSLAGAATLAGRLVAEHGRPLARPVGGVTHVFPSATALAAADPSGWAMPRKRAAAVQAVCAAGLPLNAGADRAAVRAALLDLPGIGPWTTEYVAMRALRDPDAFLPTDLGVRHALERMGHDPDAAATLAEPWRPYRAYALQHLWASL